MNRIQRLSRAVARASSLPKPTEIAERRLLGARAAGGSSLEGPGTGGACISKSCEHLEYPASA